jgi:hypothetical protein
VRRVSETQIASRVPATAPPIRTVVAPEHPRTSTIDAGAFTVSLRNDGGLFRGPPIATTRIRRRPMIQRTRWVYGTDRWAPLRGEPAPATDQPTAVPATERFEQGDTFDDADTTLQLYSGANAKVLGEPTVFSHGTASPRVVRNMRAALSLAKLKLDKGLAAVQAGELASRSGPIPGRLATVLEVGFNVPHDVSRVELNRILGIVVAGLEKLRTGLASEGLPLVAAANMRA